MSGHQTIIRVLRRVNDRRKDLSFISSSLLLFATWSAIIILLSAFTESWLAPWDTRPFRPPVGSWERVANDFFEGPPGSILPASLVTATSVAVYLYGRSKRRSKGVELTWVFAVLNLIFVVLIVLLSSWVRRLPQKWLSQSLSTVDFGYHLTWPAILVTAVMTTTLIIVQAVVALRYNKGID